MARVNVAHAKKWRARVVVARTEAVRGVSRWREYVAQVETTISRGAREWRPYGSGGRRGGGVVLHEDKSVGAGGWLGF